MRRPSLTEPRVDEAFTRSDVFDEEVEEAIAPEAYAPLDEFEAGESPELGDEPGEPMTDDDILATVSEELFSAQGQDETEVSEMRQRALDYYQGIMPSPPAGRSRAVSADVADVIEWTLPQVLSALVDGNNVASFDPMGEQDEEQAQLETDACEHVMFKENDGFIYVYTAVKDALMQRNGHGKVYWDEAVKVTTENYTGLVAEEVEDLLNPQDGSTVRPVEYEQYDSENVVVPPQMDPQTGEQTPAQPLQLYDIKVKRLTKNGGVAVEPLAPDQFLFNRDHNSIILDDVRFCAHRRIPLASTLVAEGWDPELVDDLPTYGVPLDTERNERFESDGENVEYWASGEGSSRATRQVLIHECYPLLDIDGDGIAERVMVHVAGEDGSYQLMGWEEVDDHPFIGTTAILMTHKFLGHSLWDRVRDIQDQKTDLVRAIQDNLKHQNNARLLVVAGQVNLDDMLTSRPGGIVRQKQPGMVEPLVAPQIGELGYRHLEYLDNVRTGRVGVSPDTASVAEAIAGDTAHGLERLMSAKEELTGLMIKLFAHTLWKGTLRKVREQLQKHRDSPIHFKARAKWQEVNPAEWTTRTGITVNTALSNGDRTKRQGALAVVLQQQQQVVDAGGMGTLVTEANIHNALSDFVRLTALGDPTDYWTDPQSEEAQQARQDEQEQQKQAQQQQMEAQQGLIAATAAIEGAKEQTKRMGIQQKELQSQRDAMQKEVEAQAKLIESYRQSVEDLEAKYTEMELKFSADVPGKGIEGGADAAGAEPAQPAPGGP